MAPPWAQSRSMDKARLEDLSRDVRDHLWQCLPTSDGPLAVLEEALGYACEGGKGIRGALAMESCRICGVPRDAALASAAAIEAVHAYSLVHDDLPAMDDDDLRRGRPTVHVRYDEMTAILVGDALQALGFEILSAIRDVPADRVLILLSELARGAGTHGMVGGQYLDLMAERAAAPAACDDAQRLRHIETIQTWKTGALIRWSCLTGPVLAGAQRAPFEAYADAIGLAFQIQDDLLDVEGTAEETGKAVGKDAGRGKATFVDLLGTDGARAKAQALVADAVAAMAPFGAEAGFLCDLARYIVTRRS